MADRLGTAAALGAVTGLRSMMGIAWTARALSRRRRRWGRRSRMERWLSDETVALVLGMMAVGELVADKLPTVPDRVSPGALAGRAVIGGVLGAVAGGHDSRAVGAAVGSGAAVVSAFAGWLLRTRGAGTLGSGTVAAVCEDALAITVGRAASERLR